jgi:hypothetical protein
MLPDYFKILEIPQDASEMEIKRAYRKKAKEYHPSVNKDQDSLDRFILVNEAYEILIHKNTHEIYLLDMSTHQDPLKHEVYYYWVNAARTRAAQHASLSMNEFQESKFYKKTHMYAYPTLVFFLILGLVLLIAPFIVILLGQQKIHIAIILGVIFISWPAGLYFFVQSAIGFQSMKKYMH